MEIREIAAGVHVHTHPTPKFKTVSVAILIRQPLRRETVTMNVLIAQILSRGSRKYADMARISAKTERLFGSVFETQVVKKGEQQLIQFFMEFVKRGGQQDLTAECLAFLKEMMLNPLEEYGGFRREYVDGEKENLRFAIESRVNNKAEYAKLRLVEEMCKNEPFGLYGDGYAEDLEGLTPENTLAHYKKLLRTAPVDFLAVGDLDGEDFAGQLQRLFAFEREEAEHIPPAAAAYEPREPIVTDERIGLTQGKICLGFRTGVEPASGDFYSLLLMNEIFGGGAGAKLFSVIREKENLCYYINSFVYRFKGIVLVQSGVDPENFGRVEELTGQILQEIKDNRVTEAELVTVKKSLAKKFEGAKDYPAAMMDFYIAQFMLGDRDDLDGAIAKVNGVQADDVGLAAEKLRADAIYRLC